ncbi:MAG: hypothetical protein FJW92_06030 [Actinobacteria bacterium]|nr:hypothetical protein [Actinomycetota bacterium]
MKNPRYEAKVQSEESGEPAAGRKDGLPTGAPKRAGFKSVLIRAGLAAVIFYAFLYFINGDSPQVAAGFAIVVGILMIPLGMLLDRLAHRMAVRRWQKQTGGR